MLLMHICSPCCIRSTCTCALALHMLSRSLRSLNIAEPFGSFTFKCSLIINQLARLSALRFVTYPSQTAGTSPVGCALGHCPGRPFHLIQIHCAAMDLMDLSHWETHHAQHRCALTGATRFLSLSSAEFSISTTRNCGL